MEDKNREAVIWHLQLYISTSAAEEVINAVLEAVACGLPVVIRLKMNEVIDDKIMVSLCPLVILNHD